MNKKIIYITGSIFIIAVTVIIVFFIKQRANNEVIKEDPHKQEIIENKKETTIYDVEDIVKKPEQYTGVIGVSGKIIKNDSKKMTITLGCEDACVLMPVKYSINMKKIPESEKNITAIGEIKQENGKYYFEAVDIKDK